MNKGTAEISPEMPSIATKDRQESSGKDTLMREAFMVRPSTAIPEILHLAPGGGKISLQAAGKFLRIERSKAVHIRPRQRTGSQQNQNAKAY